MGRRLTSISGIGKTIMITGGLLLGFFGALLSIAMPWQGLTGEFVIGHFYGGGNSMERSAIRLAASGPGWISGKIDDREIASIKHKFEEIAASSGDAEYKRKVAFVVLDYTSKSAPIDLQEPENLKKLERSDRILTPNRQTRLVDINLADVNETAYVLIPSRSTIFNIKNARDEMFANLAIDSKEAVDVIGATDGLIAGFRVGAFNWAKAIDPGQVTGTIRDKNRRKWFCNDINQWLSYFDVPKKGTDIWVAVDPGELEVFEHTLLSKDASSLWRRPLHNYC